MVTEKKSKFIAKAVYIESAEEAERLILDTKKEYHDARHNCYAYRVFENGNILERQSDDRRAFWNSGCTYA